MFFIRQKLYFKVFCALFLSIILVNSGFAQKKSTQKTTKQTSAKTQPTVKKTASVKETNSKTSTNTAKTRAEAARLAEAKKAAEARNRAALEAKRRRELAAREARNRKVAFEQRLRTDTVENISNDITDGEDLEARRAAVNALGNRAGTVVVMEVQTGRILTIVNQDWGIRNSFKPCSVIKLVTAVGGLNEGVIESDGSIVQSNFSIGLDDALAYSNNAYFQRVGVNLGNQKMITYAKLLGLGEPTGLNVEGETGGKLPFGNNNARIYSHGDDFEVTPLQLAVLVSAIANGGKIIVPQIPRNNYEKTNFRGFYRRQINLPSNSLLKVIPGMVGAASYGTARRGVDASLGIAGKTGSCIGQGSWVGLFASVAPVQNPRLAVVVITRGQNERGKYAAGVAGGIYNALRNRLTEKGSKLTAKLQPQLKPQSKINAQTSAKLDDAQSDDSDDEDGTMRKGKKGQDNDSETTPTKKNVKKSNQEDTTLFPTVVITPKTDSITRPRIVKKN